MRRSRLALPLLAVPLLVLGACAGLAPALAATGQGTTAGQAATAGQASAAAAATPPAHYAAPYLQITSGDAGDMAADLNASGDKYYTLAFLIPQSGCTPEWEDNGDAVGAFTSPDELAQSRGRHRHHLLRRGSGGELAQTCTSVSSLTAAYANVVNTYGVDRLDFDIEGGTLGDTAANNRRNQALAALQAQNPAVQVDFTLAVGPQRPPVARLGRVLQGAKTKGVKVAVVNIMTMDFGDGPERARRRRVRGRRRPRPSWQPVRHLHLARPTP